MIALPIQQTALLAIDVSDDAIGTAIHIVAIVAATFVAYYMLGKILPHSLSTAMVGARQRDLTEEEELRVKTLSGVLVHAIGGVIFLVGGLMVLDQLKIDITPLIASAGIVGLALAFGAQTLIKDLIAGIFILVEDQYSTGDVVSIGGKTGTVEGFNLRHTTLRDLDGYVHYVPNGFIDVATNLSKEYARVNLNVSVAYETDIERAIDVINRVGHEIAEDPEFAPRIIEAPQVLRVDDLGDSGIAIKVLGTVARLQQWAIAGELRIRIKKALEGAGIEIPFPHMVMIQKQAPDEAKGTQADLPPQ